MTNTTQVSVSQPALQDEPTAYLNPGKDGVPFSVVQLSPQMWLYIHEASHARAIAAAFTKAADLLDEHVTVRRAQDSSEGER